MAEQTLVSGLKKRTPRRKDGEAASLCTAGVARIEKGKGLYSSLPIANGNKICWEIC